MAKDSYNEQDSQFPQFFIPAFDHKKPQCKSKRQKVQWHSHQQSNTKSLNTANSTLTLPIPINFLIYDNCYIEKNSQAKHAM